MPGPHALLVEDDESSLTALSELVENEGFTTSAAKSLQEARNLASRQLPDLVVADLVLPDGTGLDLARELEELGSAEVVLITGHASVDTAIEALRRGVLDYLTKPIDIARLKSVLANVARTRELKTEIHRLREQLRELGRFGPLVGASPAMQEVYDLVSKVAPTDATVLLTGESGTGKEVVAQTLHALSGRRRGEFVPLNCGAISPSLIESELFGHERGSFTGASRTHRGVFERASGGTLLLDEITEMPIELQAKLLRVLETGSFTRIGGERPLEVEVRVIASTNRPPQEAVSRGKLREDLHFRLSVFPIHLPPLRERGHDVKLLAEHFLAQLNRDAESAKRIAPEVLELFADYDWPGNVRELKNAVKRAFILAEEEIGPESVASSLRIAEPPSSDRTVQVNVGSSIADAERRLILATLERFNNDKKKVARILGISLKTLYNRLNAYRQESADS